MKILLTNDDGIEAKGINVLFDILSSEHQVFLIAPHIQKSACSNAITLEAEMRVIEEENNKFSVSGFPSDCVNIGLNSGLIPDVDIVISGINHGANLGHDIHYSGTVAGARTAFIFGKTGIAVSVADIPGYEFLEDAAAFICEYLESEKEYLLSEQRLININYPPYTKENIKGVKYAFLGKRIYKDQYVETFTSEGHRHLKLEGTIDSIEKDNSDVTEIEHGYITITPLTLDSTDYDSLKNLNGGKNVN